MKLRHLIAASLLALLACTASASVQQAFLVQNSGWMEPFYADPASSFKPLVAAVAQAASNADDPVSLLAFSQATSTNVSPQLLAQGRGAASIGTPLQALGIARKSPGGGLADTDFKEAVTRTIVDVFKSAPGIVWIFTNNRNSPGNDQATAARNQDFYRLLHLEPSIAKTVVFPLKMPVKGRQYEARGMMVYALAYGQPAALELDRILQQGRLSKVLTTPPARLKPVDVDALAIVPESVENSPNVRPGLGADGRTLILDVDAEHYAPALTLKASLQNRFFPYVIQNARVTATLSQSGQSAPVEVQPAAVQNLRPGQRQAVTARLRLPMQTVPSAWSFEALSAMGKQVLIPMQVDMALADQQLALDEDFKQQLRELFPGDPISDVLVPPASVKSSQARVPLLLRVQYPLLPVILVMGALLVLVAAFAAVGLLWGRSSRYPVQVDGVRRQIMLKPFSTEQVRDQNGTPVAIVKRGLGRPRLVSVVDGHIVSVG